MKECCRSHIIAAGSPFEEIKMVAAMNPEHMDVWEENDADSSRDNGSQEQTVPWSDAGKE